MYIENARICDVTIVPTSDVTIVPTRYGMELELKLALQEGYYTKTFNMVTPIEDIATLCDVVGVQSYGDLIGARIRVWVPDYGSIHIIGNATDNKWLHLGKFNRMILQPGIGLLYTGDKKDRIRVKIERKVIRMKDLNKVIERPYRMTEIRKRFDKLDLVEIDTYLDQGEYFLSKESDEDCRQYIFNTIAREIAEIAYIEPPEYTPEKAKHFRDTMNKHLLLALQYNEY